MMIALDRGDHARNVYPPLAGIELRDPDDEDSPGNDEGDYLIDKALVSAVYAFSVRWLSTQVTAKKHDGSSVEKTRASNTNIRNTFWRQARKAIYPVMTRPSYRSILALHLVASTATAINHKDQGIEDLCCEVALSHHLRLRSGLQSHSMSTASTMTLSAQDMLSSLQVSPNIQEHVVEHAHMQDMAYWLGVLSDTSRSLTQCRSSVLLPGQSGDLKVWSQVRQRTQVFDLSFRSLHHSQQSMSDEVVATILQNASAYKTMYWWTITRVHDALFHHTTDELIEVALERALQELRGFQDIFGPLLDMCARDFMILNQRNQVSYRK